MQTLQSLFTKYWLFVVSERKIKHMSMKIRNHNRFFPFFLRCTFTFACLVICLNLWEFI